MARSSIGILQQLRCQRAAPCRTAAAV